jgi:putative transposase
MPRKSRYWFPGATYHVYARGNRKEDIFRDDHDRRKYLYYLNDTREKLPFILHAYCLMSNHVHLLLQTEKVPTEQIFRLLHTRYAMYFNNRHELVGHVFQDRYNAILLESPSAFIKVSRYIHLNPVEANLVESPEQYPWSSFSSFNTSKNDPYISKDRTLSFFTETKPPREQQYRNYVEQWSDQIKIKESITLK